MKPHVLIISGPTATGKSQIALTLAKKFHGVIVNFDSLLFYQELNIGTAKPTPTELESVPHYMINVRSIKDPMTASTFVKMSTPLINELGEKTPLIILVGGSGFYLRALLQGMYDSPTTPEHLLQKSERLYESEGITPFWDILQKEDSLHASKLHPNDHYRIRRAVEHFWNTGLPFSQSKQTFVEKTPPWHILHLHLDLPKDIHWGVIQKRTRHMLESGLLEEVQKLLQQEFTGTESPLQSIGYKEVLKYLQGEIPTPDDLTEKINIATRQLAKAQRTWFKKVTSKISCNPLTDEKKMITTVEAHLKSSRSP